MSTLRSRIDALEAKGGSGLVLLCISWLPTDGKRETATYDGTTYTQEPSETRDRFRERLRGALKDGRTSFLFVDQIDAAL
jgi:hypothetical protein